MSEEDERPVGRDLTRRRLLQAGAVAAAAVSFGSIASPAGARASYQYGGYADDGLYSDEVRFFAGGYVPLGWKRARAQLAGRALMGSGNVADGPNLKLGDRGDGTALRAADGEPASLALTCLEIDNPEQAPGVFLGEVRAFAFDLVPLGWYPCDGRTITVQHWYDEDITLFSVIGNRFGGDGRNTFALPDLRDRTPIAIGDGGTIPRAPLAGRRDDLAPPGEGRAPRLHLNYCICRSGLYPSAP